MKKLQCRDISELKAFEKYGDVFTQVRNNPDTGWWLYERVSKEDPTNRHYEVVRGRRHINPDGSVVFTYPSTESWGTNGYTVVENKWAEKVVDFLMGAKRRTAQEIYDFKMAL